MPGAVGGKDTRLAVVTALDYVDRNAIEVNARTPKAFVDAHQIN